jgi:hypothetical protein
MNHAVLRVTPKVRCSWLALIPFLLDQKDRLKPFVHRHVAGLEDGPDLDGEGLAARIALVGAYAGAFALQLAYAALLASWANRTVGPHAGFDELVCGFFIVKVGRGKYGHGSIPFAYP